jgi:hypothetical protein
VRRELTSHRARRRARARSLVHARWPASCRSSCSGTASAASLPRSSRKALMRSSCTARR